MKTKLLRDSLKGRLPLLLLALCLISSVVVSMVYSKFITNENAEAGVDVTAEGVLTVTVSEPDNNVYTVTNDESSNMPAYVRVAVVVNIQDADGNLWAMSAADYYTVTADYCTKLGDYYYYKGILKRKEFFEVTVTPGDTSKLPTGYSLCVQVLAEGIQCIPAEAAEEAWGATYNEAGEWTTTASEPN